MSQRASYKDAAPGVYRAMLGLHHYLEGCGLDKRLLDLVYLRASQINQCAYCIDMHWKDLRAAGRVRTEALHACRVAGVEPLFREGEGCFGMDRSRHSPHGRLRPR